MTLTLTKTQVTDLSKAAEAAEVHLRTDYSGRYMFGQTCLGVVHEGAMDFSAFILQLSQRDAELVDELRGHGTASDNMGMSMITYWPQISCA